MAAIHLLVFCFDLGREIDRLPCHSTISHISGFQSFSLYTNYLSQYILLPSGDIESMPFVEALRQLQLRVGRENFCLVHVSMVPTVGGAEGEQKTKPTQHSVKGGYLSVFV